MVFRNEVAYHTVQPHMTSLYKRPTNHRLELDRYRRKYRELVEARKFEEAVDILTDVGRLYYEMYKDKQSLPAHFLDPEDPLL